MRILKEDSPPMKVINEIENILRTNSMQLTVVDSHVVITVEDRLSYKLRDINSSGYHAGTLPRFTEDERFVLID